jgi:hypothetical protein
VEQVDVRQLQVRRGGGGAREAAAGFDAAAVEHARQLAGFNAVIREIRDFRGGVAWKSQRSVENLGIYISDFLELFSRKSGWHKRG